MAVQRRLANPPIREALVDIHVSGVGELSRESLGRVAAEIRARYPVLEERSTVETSFRIPKAGEIAAAAKTVGFAGVFFRDPERHRVAQFRRDGFTINQVGSYTSADELFSELYDLWPRYTRVAKPSALSRISLRYINELRLPLQLGEDLGRYLTAVPRVPDDAPKGVIQFEVRLVLLDQPTQHRVVVTQNLAPATTGARYLLDIEATKPGPLPIDAELSGILGRLRDLKNRVFFSMCTERALESYDAEPGRS
jgi:uncharacterized protein (TIGR04255 family)